MDKPCPDGIVVIDCDRADITTALINRVETWLSALSPYINFDGRLQETSIDGMPVRFMPVRRDECVFHSGEYGVFSRD